MSRRFGQNFLVSRAARQRITDTLPIAPHESMIWEIGPGIGAMTELILAAEPASLVVFEVDRGFCRILEEEFSSNPLFSLVAGDFLKVWRGYAAEHGTPDIVTGNLPYNIASVMIAQMIEQELLPESMVFTLQREVAQRIVAEPGSKHYSSFTLLCNLDYDTELVTDLAPGNFYPKPEVVSSVIAFRRKGGQPLESRQRALYLDTIADMFQARRKTMKNNFRNGRIGRRFGREGVERAALQVGIDLEARGETLGVQRVLEFVTALSMPEQAS